MIAAQRLSLVDDDERIRTYIGQVARKYDYEVCMAGNPQEFYDSFADFSPDVVLLDLLMPGADGVDLLRSLAESHYSVPILLMTGMDPRTMQAAEQLGREHGLRMCGGLEKPFTPPDLKLALERVLAARKAIVDDDLERAIRDGELELHYQPKVDAATMRVFGVEALLRWQHPTHGMLLPGYFIPLAEKSDVMHSLTKWVLRKAVEDLRGWRTAGWDLSVAINVSAKELSDPDFPDLCSFTLKAAGVPGSRLILEVTERQAMSINPSTTKLLQRMGCHALQGYALGHPMPLDALSDWLSARQKVAARSSA